MSGPTATVVVVTVGRPSLSPLLQALAAGVGPELDEVIVVDDRPRSAPALELAATGLVLRVLRSGGRGPAAARNLGWQAAMSTWVAFLDDGVVPPPGWRAALADDLAACGPEVAGSQGRLDGPGPGGRRPRDVERSAGLAPDRWTTTDLAYRRAVLERLGGFDERLHRADRADVDLGLRVTAAGHPILDGHRVVHQPVRPEPWHASVGAQRGNADDALLDALHGPAWRQSAGVPPSPVRRQALVTGAALAALGGLLTGRRRLAAVAGAGWVAGTAAVARRRLGPGSRGAAEVAAVAATSVAVPPVAVGWWLVGLARTRHLTAHRPVEAVLFDRDSTLVVDVPDNGDPDRVVPIPGARAALDRLRAAGIPVGIVTDQEGVARGVITAEQVESVNRRVRELLGPFTTVEVCPHGPDDACRCRKPRPDLILRSADALGVPPQHCAVVGGTVADVEAARAAGARPILVPRPATSRHDVRAAPEVAGDLGAAVDRLLADARRRTP